MVKTLEDIVYLFPNMLDTISQFCQSMKVRTVRLQLLNCMPDSDVIGYRQQTTCNRMSHVGLSMLLAIM